LFFSTSTREGDEAKFPNISKMSDTTAAALAAISALGDDITPEAAAAFALGYVAGSKPSGSLGGGGVYLLDYGELV
jgi:hypothetical protein